MFLSCVLHVRSYIYVVSLFLPLFLYVCSNTDVAFPLWFLHTVSVHN